MAVYDSRRLGERTLVARAGVGWQDGAVRKVGRQSAGVVVAPGVALAADAAAFAFAAPAFDAVAYGRAVAGRILWESSGMCVAAVEGAAVGTLAFGVAAAVDEARRDTEGAEEVANATV